MSFVGALTGLGLRIWLRFTRVATSHKTSFWGRALCLVINNNHCPFAFVLRLFAGRQAAPDCDDGTAGHARREDRHHLPWLWFCQHDICQLLLHTTGHCPGKLKGVCRGGRCRCWSFIPGNAPMPTAAHYGQLTTWRQLKCEHWRGIKIYLGPKKWVTHTDTHS